MEPLDTLILSITVGFITTLGSAGLFLIAASEETRREDLKVKVIKFAKITFLVVTAAILYFLPVVFYSETFRILCEQATYFKVAVLSIIYLFVSFLLVRLVREVWS